MVEFHFSEEQKALAYDEAHRRQSVNQAKGLKGRNGAPARGSQALGMHLIGAAAEIAVASYLGLEQYLFQETEAVRGSEDLPGIDVKCRSKHDYDLLVQLDDVPTKKFVLVTIQDKRTLIHGWIEGHQAMKQKWVKEFVKGRPCYAVPQSALQPIDSLKNHVQS